MEGDSEREMNLIYIIFAVVIVGILLGICFCVGRMIAREGKGYEGRYRRVMMWVLWTYIVFAAAVSFPICDRYGEISGSKAYTLICEYGLIAWMFAKLYGGKRNRLVYLSTLAFTVGGMSIRYLVEYGEVSNIYGFTFHNIVSYMVYIPACTMGMYYYMSRYLVKEKQEL